jgi:hypothetical protein
MKRKKKEEDSEKSSEGKTPSACRVREQPFEKE